MPSKRFVVVTTPVVEQVPDAREAECDAVLLKARSAGKSLVTFRNHTVAAMFSLPCEHAWTEPTTPPELRTVRLDRVMAS